jgi:myo-inositol-1(or 4)-monophosphatase
MSMLHEKQELIKQVAPIIREAGNIVLSYFQQKLEWYKKDGQGFATQADLASEEYLISKLKSLIPGASFIAEESGGSAIESDYCWVIDPLDGTTNFAHGLSYFCISVALTYKNEPVFGVIYQPTQQELFYAQKGTGAWLNDKRLRVSELPLEKSLMGLGHVYPKGKGQNPLQESMKAIVKQVYAIRHFGAAALDIAHVAAGRLDGSVFTRLKWWDAAAGIVILSEAGGFISDFQGKHYDSKSQSFIGINTLESHEKLINLLKTAN